MTVNLWFWVVHCHYGIFSERHFTPVLMAIGTLQTKNTGNLPVHSQNVRVYREVTGISRVYRWVTRFFLHYLSCSFVYHTKFWHQKASECTGGIPVVHDWNILNHESLHQQYFVGPSPECSTRGGIFMKYPTDLLWQHMCPISRDQCKQNSHAYNQTPSSTHHFLISAWYSFSLQLSESVGIRCIPKV